MIRLLLVAAMCAVAWQAWPPAAMALGLWALVGEAEDRRGR